MFRKVMLAVGFGAAVLVPFSGMAQSSSNAPLTLEECVQIALKQNSTFLNAQRQETIAGTNVTSARAAILPRVGTSLSSGSFRQGASSFKRETPIFDPQTGSVTGYRQEEIPTEASDRQSHSFNLSLSQTIFDFGTTINNIKQAAASRDASVFSTASTRQQTILAVHQRYFELLKNIRLLEVQQEAVKSSEEQLKRTESMFEIGSVAQADVYRARTTLGNEKITLIQQDNNVRDARALLNVQMGRDPGADLRIVDTEDVEIPSDYNMDDAMKMALTNNPSVHRFRSDMSAASYGAKSARTSFLPSIGGSVRYNRSNSELNRVYGDFDKHWSVTLGVQLDLNLFNGFADAARLERESTRYRIAEENLSETRRDLARQVQEALLDLEANKQIQELNRENLISAEEDLRLAQERYRVGAGTLLDVITAQINLTRSRATFVRAKYDTKITEARLKSAMGSL